MSEAGVYRCPACGAPADPKAAVCGYCAARLQPVRCPWCFEWTDASSKGCSRCGACVAAPAAGAKALACPSCGGAAVLSTRELGGARLSGCAACAGVWADAASFKRLCEDRATQTAYLGQGSVLPAPKASDPSRAEIRYRPCPVCGELMNRFNFAGCSGVVLDVCKPHGVWFDADEVRRIVEFIRGGGLDVARAKELQAIELERHRLELASEEAPLPMGRFQPPVPRHIASARGLLEHLLGLDD
ncbi:MAG: zf-TFIIB domain-containing protein [Elusimicrobiota bacterium]